MKWIIFNDALTTHVQSMDINKQNGLSEVAIGDSSLHSHQKDNKMRNCDISLMNVDTYSYF